MGRGGFRHLIAATSFVAALGLPAARAEEPPLPCAPPVTNCETYTFGASSTLLSLGDIDGDGLADYVERIDSFDDGYRESAICCVATDREPEHTMVLIGRKGTDGEELWRRSWRVDAGDYVTITPGNMGPDALESLLLSFGSAGRLIALSRDGETMWEAKTGLGFVVGAGNAPDRATLGYARPRAPRQLTGSPALDVATVTTDVPTGIASHTAAAVSTATQTTFALAVIDGADGSEAWHWIATFPGEMYAANLLGDLDADETPDLVVWSLGYHRPATVVAYSGRSGAMLWARTDVPSQSSGVGAYDAGDVNGDGRHDVVTTGSYSVPDGGAPAANTALIDGRTGNIRWTRAAGFLTKLGDIDGDGQDEVGGVRYTTIGEEASLRFEAFNGTGDAVYSRMYTLQPPGPGFANAWEGHLGDLDGDGVDETGIELTWRGQNGSSIYQPYVLSGRTGNVLWAGAWGSFFFTRGGPVRGTLDGDRSDLVTWTPTEGGIDLTGKDGATGTPLWTRYLQFERGTTSTRVSWSASDVTGDGRVEVLVTLETSDRLVAGGQTHYVRRTATYVIDGASGAALRGP